MKNYYSNFQNYLKNGNRVAAFGREKEGKVELFLLYCNRNDSFSKHTATQLYNYYIENGEERMKHLFPEFHPIILLLPINENDSVSYTFQKYCTDNFYKKRIKVAMCIEECLVKGSVKIVQKIKKFPKLVR